MRIFQHGVKSLAAFKVIVAHNHAFTSLFITDGGADVSEMHVKNNKNMQKSLQSIFNIKQRAVNATLNKITSVCFYER